MKAVVRVGGKQYIVAEKDTLLVDGLPRPAGAKELSLDTLLLFDHAGKAVVVGRPLLKDASVKAKVLDETVKGDKLRIIRFKAKKRVNKQIGHRQRYLRLQVTSISGK